MFARCLAAALTVTMLNAQPAPVKAFDVASMKRSDPNTPSVRGDLLPGGRVIFRNLTMRFLFEYVYGVRHYETSGEPAWFDERYDIDAIAGGAGEMTDAEVKPPLQALLEDRLKLAIHRETREMLVYDLVVSPGGARIRAADPEEKPAVRWASANKVVMEKIPLKALANFLSGNADILRPVTDQTGLAGEFDFTLQWTPEPAPGNDGPSAIRQGPSIFTALNEQLGLRLVAKKGPDQILIVDHVERPSEN